MNLLSELQGLSGENLCSAALRLLLLRSQDLRDCFVNLLSRESRSGPITLGSHFSCTLEEPTEDSGRWGRLDLLLETSDAVVGVENKLFASFQEGQPHKYFDTVEQRAKGLKQIRGRNFQPLVAVLAPKSRHPEIDAVIGENEGLLCLDWEELLTSLAGRARDIDPETRIILSSLESYIYEQISLFPEWARWIPHLHRKFDCRGTELQRQVVGKVWQFFPDPGGRLSSGATWCGYYFTDQNTGARGWYGFVPQTEIVQGNKYKAEFIIATSFEVPFLKSAFRTITMKAGPNFINASQIYSWAVDFDESWSGPDSWRNHLQPLNTAYEELKQVQAGKTT